ncbi:hypothetical protein [Lysobacter gummosus]|uniref:hypothetical protein n=1 Tax=Lysobacter gummosus TaxID=262324 RepID=UPI003625CCB7
MRDVHRARRRGGESNGDHGCFRRVRSWRAACRNRSRVAAAKGHGLIQTSVVRSLNSISWSRSCSTQRSATPSGAHSSPPV